MKIRYFGYAVVLVLLVASSCENSDTKLVTLDLMSKGIPVKIMAPENADIKVDDLGIIKDVTIKDSLDYFVQIFASKASSLNPVRVKEEQMKIVEEAPYFSKIVQEDEHGFIFEKKIDEDNIRYDFRYIRIQGEDRYIFQTGLSGGYDEAAVRRMYEAVK